MKKVLLLVFLVACIVTGATDLFAARDSFKAVYDGETVKAVALRTVNDQPYVALKDVAAVYGARMTWRQVSGKVSLQMNNRQMDVFLNNTRVRIGDARARLSAQSKIIKNNGYIPLDFLTTQAFNDFAETTTSWNDEAGILTVNPRVTVVASRYYARPDGTQVIIEMSDDISGAVSDATPGKLVVTLPRGRVKEETVAVGSSAVNDIRLANDGREAVVTVTLASGARMTGSKSLNDPRRLVLDIASSHAAPLPSTVAVDTGATSEQTPVEISSASVTAVVAPTVVPALVVPVPAAAPAATTAKRPLIVLDAGHGGEDPGAIGPNGTREKEINLAIVRELKRLFEEDGRFDVALTRTDDTFIPLVERTSMANEKQAEMFISVHCNANFDRKTSGFEIYFLNENASDEDAAATAVLENSVVKLEGKPNKKRASIQALLWSLAINEFINESSELCSFINTEAPRRTRIPTRGVKQAGFYVLRGAQMPAVLVECAFLTNYAEEAKLRSRKFQAGIADAIYEGIKQYGDRREKLARAAGPRREPS